MSIASSHLPSATAAGPTGNFASVTPDLVTRLQSLRGDPSISILANTQAGPTMQSRDIATLKALTGIARQRLSSDGVEEAPSLLDRLYGLINGAADRPADRGVALLVSAAHSFHVTLPVPVVDRCVIDPTFATRDLVRALHHTPRHAVLILSMDQARLLHGHGNVLTAAPTSAFPIHRRTTGKNRARNVERPNDFLRRVDRALGTALRLNPMPLVLVAAEPTGSTFRGLSRNTARLAGIVKGNHLTTSTEGLVDLIRPVLRDYLKSRSRDALELIEQRSRSGRVLRDINSAWLAARWERPEMLAVEEDFYYPARLGLDEDNLLPAEDVDHPDVIDDAVDELIEIVLSRGGWIALLAPGELPDDTRVALTLRRR